MRLVLRPGGALIVAVPAGDDLIELWCEAVQGAASPATAPALVAEHAGGVQPDATGPRQRAPAARRRRVALAAVGPYRGARAAESRAAALDTLDVNPGLRDRAFGREDAAFAQSDGGSSPIDA